jgi:hypothetical protein
MPGKTLLNPTVNRYQPADPARYGITSDGLLVVALLYGLIADDLGIHRA